MAVVDEKEELPPTLNWAPGVTVRRREDLDAVQRMQSAIFAAKGGAGSLRMSAAAKAKFGYPLPPR